MVDENAQIVDGDVILAICAKDLKRRGILQNNKVVATVMSNFGFLKAMESCGIDVVQSQVGDRYVIQEMVNHGAILGGEPSGHLVFLDLNTTGDGLVSALQVLRIMIETDSRLSDLAALVKRYPQVLLNIKVSSKPALETLTKVSKEIDHAEKVLGKSGRVLVRYSGTEKACRVMVEGEKQKQVQQLADSIASAVRESIGV
jgi:phosphoglucosamine mutase